MFSRFFIDRPIFASVISILIVIAGGISLFKLPIAQFPEITPPAIQVTAVYPGADPQVVADTVAAPIEEEINGVERMIYMGSTSSSDGSYSLKITFELGTDVDMANVLVQNRVSRALAKLPQEVQRQGVTTKKSSTALVSVISLSSTGPYEGHDDLFLSNFAMLHVKDELVRINGVGDITIFPQKNYGMRIWLNPNRLEYRGLVTNDVVNALRQQNVQVAAGQIGQPPAPKDQDFQWTVNTLGRFSEAEEFENIIVKAEAGGRITSIKDVAQVELGGKDYNSFSTLNGVPAATLVAYQTPGSNALEVADRVREAMAHLKESFPEGVEYKVVYDTSEFIRESVNEVVGTLFVACILVFLVVLVFLQDWRATLIPAVTIPVSLIGTFAAMTLFGFSINMTTLFGLVLAIGIVVDDAIVVVENVDRNMTELGLSPKEAAMRAMEEITGPVISITLVLMAVFVPAAFLGGIVGELYRQFSLTIAVSTFFSAISALTLSPALCALLLRPEKGRRNAFFRGFNFLFGRLTGYYSQTVAFCVRKLMVMAILFGLFLGLTYFCIKSVPLGFVPLEDDGLIVLNVQLPEAASLERTKTVLEKLGDVVGETDGVADCVFLGGFSVLDGAGSNLAAGFAPLTPWKERARSRRTKDAIMQDLARKFTGIQEAIAISFSFPPIRGLGKGAGFEMQVLDRAGLGLANLEEAVGRLAYKANSDPELRNVFSTFQASVPTVRADVDREKALKMGVPLQSVFDTMQAYLGSAYVNDFSMFGRIWQVMVQADSDFRSRPSDIARLQVRNNEGKMVPLGTLAKVEESLGPPRIERYNMFPAARISGTPAPGVSTGTSLETMERLARSELPAGIGYEWTGLSYQEKRAGTQAGLVYVLAVIVVVLILAALYESWLDPLAVVLIVPMAVLGALVALLSRGMDNNLYTQVGLVLLVGLSAKNAILIVEFAREMRDKGKPVPEAAVEGARLRFRPILMTSFAFIIGVLPLVIASGAGAAGRRSLGTAVFGGMLGVTILGVIFTPVLYVAIQKVRSRLTRF